MKHNHVWIFDDWQSKAICICGQSSSQIYWDNYKQQNNEVVA